MKREHLKIGVIAVGAAVIAIGCYFAFRPKAVEQDHFTAAESACLARIAPEFQQLLATQWARRGAETQQAITVYGQNKSLPNFDTTTALNDYKDKVARVKLYTAYCEQRLLHERQVALHAVAIRCEIG